MAGLLDQRLEPRDRVPAVRFLAAMAMRLDDDLVVLREPAAREAAQPLLAVLVEQ